ncbi:MAG: hypothetical protein WCH58_03755 [Candidatus Saccharibacteria bacterium]
MEIKPQTTKPISDDQELAKVLAGVTKDSNSDLSFEESPLPQPTPAQAPVAIPINNPTDDSDLNSIKKEALIELRPLVDKLDLSPEEKFDTYLLLLRSTDDQTLIAPAHNAAKNIADETRRAQALLDVIKEIDYLSAPQQ